MTIRFTRTIKLHMPENFNVRLWHAKYIDTINKKNNVILEYRSTAYAWRNSNNELRTFTFSDFLKNRKHFITKLCTEIEDHDMIPE